MAVNTCRLYVWARGLRCSGFIICFIQLNAALECQLDGAVQLYTLSSDRLTSRHFVFTTRRVLQQICTTRIEFSAHQNMDLQVKIYACTCRILAWDPERRLIPWNEIFPEDLRVAQLVKKFHVLYETRSAINILTGDSYLILSWTIRKLSTASPTI
jgi:hypothetical protein